MNSPRRFDQLTATRARLNAMGDRFGIRSDGAAANRTGYGDCAPGSARDAKRIRVRNKINARLRLASCGVRRVTVQA